MRQWKFKQMLLLISESPRATAHRLSPWVGLVARPYWLPMAPLSFSKMKPGGGWQGGPAPEGPRPLGLHTVTAVASLGTGYRVECFSKGTVRSRAAASSRNQQSFPVLGWTSAAGSGFSSLSSKMRCVERAGEWGSPHPSTPQTSPTLSR